MIDSWLRPLCAATSLTKTLVRSEKITCETSQYMTPKSRNVIILTFTLLMGFCPSTVESGSPPQRERNVIWRNPGDVRKLDLAAGPGGPDGAPAPPFHF